MFTNFFVKSISRKLKMISQSDYKSYTGCYEFKNGCHCCSLIPRQISSPKMTTNIYTLSFRSMKNSNSFFKEQFELHSTLIMRKKIVQFLVYNKFPHIFHQLILGISMIFLFTLRPYHFIIIYSLCFLLLFFSPGKALLAGKGISRQVSSQVLCRHSPPTIQMTSKNSFELVISDL